MAAEKKPDQPKYEAVEVKCDGKDCDTTIMFPGTDRKAAEADARDQDWRIDASGSYCGRHK